MEIRVCYIIIEKKNVKRDIEIEKAETLKNIWFFYLKNAKSMQI